MRLSLRARLALSFAAAVAGALVVFSLAVVGVLAASERDEPDAISESASRVLFSMALVAPFAIGGAAALGFWLARRAVAPLREASVRARAARASELDLTLPVGGAGDEWEELAGTLNTLLADGRGALERIRRFTADAAHELRTPLTVIMGEAEVALRRERGADELRASLGIVREEADRLAGVLDALLTLARADAGTLLGKGGRCPLDEVVREAVTRAEAGAQRSQASGVRVTVAGSGPWIQGERVLLVQALRNVIENGLRYGGGRVDIELAETPGWVLVRVADQGPGIPAALQPLLFQRFARADEARSTRGLGLGLAIARAIAEAHGGALALVPSARGAVFEFRLPA
jgi:signal transduction histidine kinase